MIAIVLALPQIFAEHTIGLMDFTYPDLTVVPAIGAVGLVIGLLWMVRILRRDPEAHPTFWRFGRS